MDARKPSLSIICIADAVVVVIALLVQVMVAVIIDGTVLSHPIERERGRRHFLGGEFSPQIGGAFAKRLTGLLVGALLANVLPVTLK